MYVPVEGLISRAELLVSANEIVQSTRLIRNNKKIQYYNIPAAFDIEVSSFYDEYKNKRAIMYVWQFGIYNSVTVGRTWTEFENLMSMLKKILGLNNERRLIIYVHNLSYEFQFIRKRFNWDEVFILSERKPVYALADGFEFRCSYKLSNKSLENVAKDLLKYKAQKQVGDLDYTVLRTPLTPLTQKELGYCEMDIRVLLHYIQEKIEQDGDITKIPLTNTGYVREFCRKQCYKRWRDYRNIMNELTIDADEYSQLKCGFQGGFTHANARYVGQTLENVRSFDFGSSYPGVMVLEGFPMSHSRLINNDLSDDELIELFYTHCCLFDIAFHNIVPIKANGRPLSKSKCRNIIGAVVDNGRIVGATYLETTITEQDFFVLDEFYTWDKVYIDNLRVYEKQYLPTPFVRSILSLYRDKTELKGKEGEEVNYMIRKGMINSAYGMSVTDPVREGWEYVEDSFKRTEGDIAESIDKYNNNVRRFLFYPWGVWVTAYARANLFSGIIEMGKDYVYSDTDSIKCLNAENHSEYFKAYNEQIEEKIAESAAKHKLPPEMFAPFTIKGKRKPIGVWEDEGVYEKFKTLGAKRYLTFRHETRDAFDDNGATVQLTVPTYEVTIAGPNKQKTRDFLRRTRNPFGNFKINLNIPPDSAGRLQMTYIDEETEGDVIGIDGAAYHYHELSSIHAENTDYTLSRSKEFKDFLNGIKNFND